ncbi:MAG: beta-lactamase family protein, partial [Gemmatimonadetes bacterium]|nr:beta-lactamase family protein [Gemmatimonadota bacterium]
MNTTTTSRTLAVTALTALSLGLAAPVAAQEPAPAAPPPQAPTLDAVVAEDLTSFATGMVAGVVVQGELDFLAAWGTPDRQSTDSLEATSLLASPGMTEILVAVTVRALGAAGLLDPQAPLSRILAEATGRLGQVTLDQLLSHTSGLDNAAVP